MRGSRLSAILLGIAFAPGCGGSPSEPSSTTTSATETFVIGAVTQAVSQAAIVAPGSDVPNTITFPCPDGGSITSTHHGTLPPNLDSTIATSSRTEFNDCKSQNVIVRGDPYLLTTGEHTFGPIVDGRVSSAHATMRTTGGLRFETNGTLGRAQYNCTMAIAIQFANSGPPQVSVTPTGEIEWEQPLGTPVRRVACGPPR